MTNPSIPPCPVCGVVPNLAKHCTCQTMGGYTIAASGNVEVWTEMCDCTIGRALRTHGIHTLAQLTERLSPDPRVAVLDKIGITNEHDLHIVIKAARAQAKKGRKKVDSHHSDVARMCDELIAAQRGEG